MSKEQLYKKYIHLLPDPNLYPLDIYKVASCNGVVMFRKVKYMVPWGFEFYEWEVELK